MEETKTTNIKKARYYAATFYLIYLFLHNYLYSLNCMNGKWTRIRKQYCKDHDMIVCSKCYTALHVKCCCEEIISINDVKDCIDLVKNLLNSITDNNKKFRISCYTKDFDSEIKSFAESLASIDNKVSLTFLNAFNIKTIHSFRRQLRRMHLFSINQFWMI